MEGDHPQGVSATRKLCLVAEAVYTAFFGAFYYKAHEDMKGLSPWEEAALGYRWACTRTQSSLVEGFKDLANKERTKRCMKANFENLKETKTEEELADYCEQAALSLAHSKAVKDSCRMRLKAQLDIGELARLWADMTEKQRDYQA